MDPCLQDMLPLTLITKTNSRRHTCLAAALDRLRVYVCSPRAADVTPSITRQLRGITLCIACDQVPAASHGTTAPYTNPVRMHTISLNTSPPSVSSMATPGFQQDRTSTVKGGVSLIGLEN